MTKKRRYKRQKKDPKPLEKTDAPPSDAESQSDQDEGAEFEVEALLDVRIGKGGRRSFLVRWKDYGPKYDEWIVEKDISASLVKSYDEKHQKKQKQLKRQQKQQKHQQERKQQQQHSSPTSSPPHSPTPPSVPSRGPEFDRFCLQEIASFAIASNRPILFRSISKIAQRTHGDYVDSVLSPALVGVMWWREAAQDFENRVVDWERWLELFTGIVPLEHQVLVSERNRFLELRKSLICQVVLQWLENEKDPITFQKHKLPTLLPDSLGKNAHELNEMIARHDAMQTAVLSEEELQRATAMLAICKAYNRLKTRLLKLARAVHLARAQNQPLTVLTDYRERYPGKNVFLECRDYLVSIFPRKQSLLEKQAREIGD